MNQRENMLALLNGEEYQEVPVWFLGFDNEDLARKLNPNSDFPTNLSPNPEKTDYVWDRITDEERQRTLNYNQAFLKPAVIVGWGANMMFGHGGPGEFHFRLIDYQQDERTLICETGCKRLVRKNPHFYRDFDYSMKTINDVDLLELPDPKCLSRYKGIEEDVRYFKNQGYFTGANLNGFFSGPHYFCLDYEEFLLSIALDPINTKKLIDKVGDWNLCAAEQLLSKGIDCITLCDDLGSANNLLVNPRIYQDWIFPWHKKLCDLAHDFGAYVHLHSHGNLKKILPDILATGVDMLNPFAADESMDLVEYLESRPNSKTIPVGGLHKQMFEWDQAMQKEWLNSLFKKAKKAGRWIFGDSSGIPGTITNENYTFFIETVRKLCKD
jgi:hypothetical protein